MCYGTEHHANFRGRSTSDFGPAISSMMRGVMSHMQNCWTSFEGWVPHFTEEYENFYKIMVPLPGFAKQDIEVSLISDNLNIKAKAEINTDGDLVEPKKTDQLNRNHVFRQTFTNLWDHGINLDIKLPPNVNTEEITSKMADGLLQIKLGKEEPKRINIDEKSNEYK